MAEKSENYFIDFLRFVFSLCILCYHSWLFSGEYGSGILNFGFLAVDFYFIVTGYLMINSLQKTKSIKAPILSKSFEFVFKKINRLIPALIVTFIVGLVFVYGRSVFLDYRLLLSNKIFPELFQLSILEFEISINGSWWYISAMIIVIAILCPFALKYDKYFSYYIAPLIVLFGLGIVNHFKININDPAGTTFFLRNGFYKALIFIPLGNIAYALTEVIGKTSFSKFKRILLTILEFAIYTVLLLNMQYYFIETFLSAILLMFNISLTFSNITYTKNLFRHSICKKLGNYGLYIFLCNVSIRTYMLRNYMALNMSYKQLLLRFFVISCVVALFLYLIVEVIYKRLKDFMKRKF